jgi:hypothetical protein
MTILKGVFWLIASLFGLFWLVICLAVYCAVDLGLAWLGDHVEDFE